MVRAKAKLICLYVRKFDIELQVEINAFIEDVDVLIITLVILIIRIILCNSVL